MARKDIFTTAATATTKVATEPVKKEAYPEFKEYKTMQEKKPSNRIKTRRTKDKRLQILTYTDTYEAMIEAATAEGISLNELANKAFELYLKEGK